MTRKMRPLEKLVEIAAPQKVTAAIFGSHQPAVIAGQLAELAQAGTGRTIAGGLWAAVSVAFVAGVVLDDGTEIVLRAYQPHTSPHFVAGVVRVQRHLAESGFQAARPLSDALTFEWGIGRLEAHLPDPGMRRARPEEMEISVAGLAEVTTLAAQVEASGLDQAPMAATGALYPEPHTPLFDFNATAAGAEWIDEIAAPAKEALSDDDQLAVSHGDWSARNVRFGSHCIERAYDWESLELAPESVAVGVAAATWRSTGEADDAIAPDPTEIAQYVDLYSRYRPLTRVQRRATLAMAVYALAYTARCEHARDPGTRTRRATARLASDSSALLALFR